MGTQVAGLILAVPFWSTFGVLPASLCSHFVGHKKWLKRIFAGALIVCALGAAVYYFFWAAAGGIDCIGPGMIDMTDAEFWHMTPVSAVAFAMLAVDILQFPWYVVAKRVRSERQKAFLTAAVVCSVVVSLAAFVPLIYSLTTIL